MATIFRAQDPPLDPGRDRRWSRTVVALVLAAIAVVLPVRSYVGHLSDVHALEDRAPTLAGFAGVDVDAVDNPIPNRHGSLLEMRVEARAGATAEETADAVRLALIEEGFRPSYSDETLSRMIEPRRRGWQRYDRAMVEPIDNGALVSVTVGPQSQRDALPAWLLLGTALLVVATGVVRSGRSGSRSEPGLRRWLGSTVLGLGALQAGLVIWALERARSHIEGYEAEFGPITPVYSTTDPALGVVRHAVGNEAFALYPFGVASILLVAPLWVVAVFAVVPDRRRRSILIGVFGLVAAVTLSRFGSINATMLNLLD